jgi:sulfite reductase (ferredoxin)
VIFRDIPREIREEISAILRLHNVREIDAVDALTRNAMACPALPLCGLAVTEAERRMPEVLTRVGNLLGKLGIPKKDAEMIIRVTGCPNGCARPYMAELGLVGDGPDMYQVWVGGNPGLTGLAFTYANKVKYDDMERVLEPLFMYWKSTSLDTEHADNNHHQKKESFGEFCTRMGPEKLTAFSEQYYQKQ